MGETSKKRDYIEKLLVGTSYFLRLLILIEAVTAAWNKNLLLLFLSLGILILTFLPSFIERNYKINLPTELEFLVVIFISSSLFLGEMQKFYIKFWWWDIFLHSISGITLAFMGFLMVYIIYTEKKMRTTPKFVALFSFSFAVAIGVLWEIVEFTIDSSIGWNMQKSGLVDTMWDLIVNSISACVISLLGYFYLKRKEPTMLFRKMLIKFVTENPHLFRKRR